MITVGLVKELYFIVSVTHASVSCDIQVGGGQPLHLVVTPEGVLTVRYYNQDVWRETVEGDTSFFGIESCDTISRIISCINNGTDWSQYRWTESP